MPAGERDASGLAWAATGSATRATSNITHAHFIRSCLPPTPGQNWGMLTLRAAPVKPRPDPQYKGSVPTPTPKMDSGQSMGHNTMFSRLSVVNSPITLTSVSARFVRRSLHSSCFQL